MDTQPFIESSVTRRRGRFDVKKVRPGEIVLGSDLPPMFDSSLITTAEASKLTAHLAEIIETPSGAQTQGAVYARQKFSGVRQVIVAGQSGRPVLRWALDLPYGYDSVIVPSVVAKACALPDTTDWLQVTRHECARALATLESCPPSKQDTARTVYLVLAARSATLNLEAAEHQSLVLHAAGTVGTSEHVEEMEMSSLIRGQGSLWSSLSLRQSEAREKAEVYAQESRAASEAVADWHAELDARRAQVA